jgi:predicted nucleic acid-binding protein
MIVVSDTTAITTVIKAGEVQFLQDCLGRVLVPAAVWKELTAFHQRLPDCIRLHPVSGSLPANLIPSTLGAGEREAIQLAVELHADLLVTDDRQARRAAVASGLSVTGKVGLVVQARVDNRIPSAKEMLVRLQNQGGIYLSESVMAEAARLAGEPV